MMTKKKAERLATSEMLDTILAELLALRATVENIARTIDSAGSPLHFHPQTGALTDEPVVLVEPEPQSDTVKVAEAAGMLKVSEFTVRAMCKDGRLTAMKDSNAAGWRITRKSVLDEWNRRWG